MLINSSMFQEQFASKKSFTQLDERDLFKQRDGISEPAVDAGGLTVEIHESMSLCSPLEMFVTQPPKQLCSFCQETLYLRRATWNSLKISLECLNTSLQRLSKD